MPTTSDPTATASATPRCSARTARQRVKHHQRGWERRDPGTPSDPRSTTIAGTRASSGRASRRHNPNLTNLAKPPIPSVSKGIPGSILKHAGGGLAVGASHVAGAVGFRPAIEEPLAARDEQRPDEHRVDRDPDHQGKTKLAERRERAEQERGERDRRDRRRRRDQATRLRSPRDRSRLSAPSVPVSSWSRAIRKTL